MPLSVLQVIVLFWMAGRLVGQEYDDLGDYSNLAGGVRRSKTSEGSYETLYPYTAEHHGPVGHAPEYDWTLLKDGIMHESVASFLSEFKGN